MSDRIAIIPARGGSVALPLKNIKRLCGRELIGHTIKQALASKLVDRVIVSTDNAEIAEVSRRFGAEVPFVRPAELSDSNTTLLLEVVSHAIRWLEVNDSYSYDLCVLLCPTSPFRRPGLIDDVLTRLIEDTTIDSCMVGKSITNLVWRKRETEFELLETGIRDSQRQTRDRLYLTHFGLATGMRRKWALKGDRYAGKVDILVEDEGFSWVDINDRADFDLAELIMSKLGGDYRG